MLRTFVLLALVGMTTMARAAEFPSFDDLPVSKELPDPLKMFDGTPVKTSEDWFKKRRPELKALIEHYMYGVAPPAPNNVTGKVVRQDAKALGGKATLEEITLTFGPESKGRINLLLIRPNAAQGKSPVFVGLNFNGNHTVLRDPAIQLSAGWQRGTNDHVAHAGDRGKDVGVWCAELLVDRGYTLATAYYGDVDPDKDAKDEDWSDGIHPLYYKPGQTKPAPNEWASIRAWAWGVSRMVDYLVTRDELDPKRIAVIGHSRLGKTALVAGAMDERIAIVCPHQSGTGGCAASRFNDQETVKRINTSFPHWFNDNFVQFNDHEEKIPFDQHCLMALCAPRPVFDTEGLQDKWANFDNSFRSLKGADPVYKLIGAKGLTGKQPIEQDDAITSENLGGLNQYRRDEKHVLNAGYWERILDFADKWSAQQ
jgi:dienelactone hydrolase